MSLYIKNVGKSMKSPVIWSEPVGSQDELI